MDYQGQIASRPTNLSGCLQTFNESQMENSIRTSSEDGTTIKVRRRTTAFISIADATVTVKQSDVELWKYWYNVSCQGGVLPTYFKMPNGAEELWRFSAPLSINWIQGKSPGQHMAIISMKIEQLPTWKN